MIRRMATTRLDTAAEVVRRARTAAGLTQAELAARAGVTQSVISAYESGRREPAVPTLARLVEAAGMRLDLGVTDGPTSTPPRTLPNGGLGGHLRRLRRQVRRVAAAYGGTRVQVFGSVARGEDRTGSDIDLLIDLPEDISLFELGRLTDDLTALLGAPVDVTPAHALKPAVRRRIERDRVPL
jgi:uncharacterized protein